MLPFTDALVRTTHFDDEMRQLADRHYSRRTVGARQFLYSGRKLVLRDTEGLVLFAWMWPDEDKRMDGQRGYNNAIFRNESTRRSSDIILEAEVAAFEKWGPNRLYTYIDPEKVRSPNPGYCFKMAGWHYEGLSKGGKHRLAKYDEHDGLMPCSRSARAAHDIKPCGHPAHGSCCTSCGEWRVPNHGDVCARAAETEEKK